MDLAFSLLFVLGMLTTVLSGRYRNKCVTKWTIYRRMAWSGGAEGVCHLLTVVLTVTVNPEIFARIIFREWR